MKILKASDYHPFVNDFINNKSKEEISYNKLIHKFFDYCYAESNFFKLNIEEDKGYQVEEVISNNEKLQTQWAVENELKFTYKNWFYEILFAQIDKFRPNVFLHTTENVLKRNL